MPDKIISAIVGAKGILAVVAGVISTVLEPTRPTGFKDFIYRLFCHILFAGFIIYIAVDPLILGIEWVLKCNLEETVKLLIAASCALSAKDIIVFLKEKTPEFVKSTWGRIVNVKK